MKIVSEPVCVAPAGDRCGEGPVWHAATQALYWTDINRFLIHRFDPCRKSLNSWFFDEPVTALALTDRDDTLAVVLGSRLILWTPETGRAARPRLPPSGVAGGAVQRRPPRSPRLVLDWLDAQ